MVDCHDVAGEAQSARGFFGWLVRNRLISPGRDCHEPRTRVQFDPGGGQFGLVRLVFCPSSRPEGNPLGLLEANLGICRRPARSKRGSPARRRVGWRGLRQTGRTSGALTRQIMLNLTEKDGKISGDFVGFTGKPAAIRDVKLKDGELSFKVPQQMGPNTFTINFVAKLAGDKMQGTAKIATPAGTREFPFQGERLKTPTVSAAGTWKLHIALRDGTTFRADRQAHRSWELSQRCLHRRAGRDVDQQRPCLRRRNDVRRRSRSRRQKVSAALSKERSKASTLSGTVDYDFDGMTGYVSFTGERSGRSAGECRQSPLTRRADDSFGKPTKKMTRPPKALRPRRSCSFVAAG